MTSARPAAPARLLIVIAVFVLAVVGAAGAFGYPQMFGGARRALRR